jgi:hypothetical protein
MEDDPADEPLHVFSLTFRILALIPPPVEDVNCSNEVFVSPHQSTSHVSSTSKESSSLELNTS